MRAMILAKRTPPATIINPSVGLVSPAAATSMYAALSSGRGMHTSCGTGPDNPPRYEEMGGGDRPAGNECSLERIDVPENLLGDGCYDARHYVCTRASQVRGFASDIGNDALKVKQVDYPVAGTVGQSRAVFETLFALGTHDETEHPGVLAGFDSISTFPASGAEPSLGFRLDWGIALLSFAPFNMKIVTSGWRTGVALPPTGIAAAQATCDRTVELRVYPGASGGSVFIPWAQRFGTGMQIGQPVIGYVPFSDVAPPATIRVAGLPAPIAAAFSQTVTLLTSFSPSTAFYAKLQNFYGGVEAPAEA